MISGRTRVAAVIGDPISHSLSPVIHNAAFAALDLDWVYTAFRVKNGGRAVEAMRTLGIGGLSVTMPHKQTVAAGADARTEAVERLGVANTLFWRDGAIWADSTDGDGFVDAYCGAFAAEVAGRRFGVIGAGGAARSIIEALGRAGAEEIVVHNRSHGRAVEAAHLAQQARAGTASDLEAVDVVVNASSVGMTGGPAPQESPVPPEMLRPGHHVVDIVYKPRCTPLMEAARQRGAIAVDGVGMLVHQAARQFQRWTGCQAPIEVMERAVIEA